MAGDSDSNWNENSTETNTNAPENSPAPETTSPPAPEADIEESNSPLPSPPSSDSVESESPPPPPSPPPSSPPSSSSSPLSSPPQSSPPPSSPPPPPPKSKKDNTDKPPTPSKRTDKSPPLNDNSSDNNSPKFFHSSSSPSPPAPSIDNPWTPARDDPGGESSNNGEASLPPPVQEITLASPENVPEPPGVFPSTTTTIPAFSPPMANNYSENTPPNSSAVAGGRSSGESGNQTSSSSPTRSYSKSSPSSGSASVGIVAGIVGGIVALILVAILVVCLRKKKKKKAIVMTPVPPGTSPYGWDGRSSNAQVPGGPPMANSTDYEYSSQHPGPNMTPATGATPGGFGLSFNKSTFSYQELATATNGFDQANMLGQGGFGYVHKGVLPDGKIIAVKSLKAGSGQGEREFMAEVEMLSRVHHRHLVSLVGYCIANGQRMLVYEFLPNDTLEYHLHKKLDTVFDFPTRLRIALGSAKGLAYLHEDCHPRIIHRDIKASNILLDENFEAMVADFGLAKLTTDTNTHVSTRVMGTFGYLAPEYAASGKLTEKSDVFSFGVMLLELITGRRPVSPNMEYMEDSLVDWSRPLLSKALDRGKFDELVDPKLEGNYNSQEMQRMIASAAASIRHSGRKRPKMSQIVRVLEGDVSLEDLNEGMKQGQGSAYNSSNESSEYDTRQYSADLKKFRQLAFASQELVSSEYGGNTTSDYGLNPSTSSSSQNSREVKR